MRDCHQGRVRQQFSFLRRQFVQLRELVVGAIAVGRFER